MRIETMEKETHFLIKVNKEWTMKYTTEIFQLVEMALFLGNKTIALDLSLCRYAPISIVGFLARLFRECLSSEAKLILLNPNAQLRKILRESQLDEVVNIFVCEDELEMELVS